MKALELNLTRQLKEKLHAHCMREHKGEKNAARNAMVTSGDRSDRVRTYHWPRGQVTDHRIKGESFLLGDVMAGEFWGIWYWLRRDEMRSHLDSLLTDLVN